MKTASEEFMFIREKIQQIARLILVENYVEATWILGCLNEICNYASEMYKENIDE